MNTARLLLLSLAVVFAAAQPLPNTEAESLAGRKLTLPAALAGKPAIVVWSFSKDAGETVKDWLVPLNREALPVWSAAMLEAAPRLIRPFIRSAMKKDVTPALLDRTFCLYKGEKEWRAALGVTNDKLPFVLLLDAQSRPVWKHSGPFQPATFATLRQQLSALQ